MSGWPGTLTRVRRKTRDTSTVFGRNQRTIRSLPRLPAGRSSVTASRSSVTRSGRFSSRFATRYSKARGTSVRCLVLAALVGVLLVPDAARAASTATVTSTRSTPFPKLADKPYGAYLKAVAADLDRFWAAQMRSVYGRTYKPLKGYYAFSSASLPPSCGRQVTYEMIRGNAFYCMVRDYIAFDVEELFPAVRSSFGDVALAMIVAHEMGHAIQQRTSTRFRSVYQELQADCFSGAWLKRASSGASPLVKVTAAELDDALSAALAFRDPPGFGAAQSGAHGNGFDRVGAIQLGFDEGVSRCAAFADLPPEVTASEYVSYNDVANDGDVPIDDAISLSTRLANAYFPTLVPGLPVITPDLVDQSVIDRLPAACPGGLVIADGLVGVCPSNGAQAAQMAFDRQRVALVYDREGDAAVGTVFALGWAGLAQLLAGFPTTGAAADLQRVCFAGGWLRALADDTSDTSLSPDDLDEGVSVALGISSDTTGFERVRAMRSGYLTRSAGCRS